MFRVFIFWLKQKEEQSLGFFSPTRPTTNFFGDNVAETEESCGECNAPLIDHLKKCDDLGVFPPLVEKCTDFSENREGVNIGKSSCKDCKRPDPIKPPVEEEDCGVPEIVVVSPRGKCRPLPETDCAICNSDWLCAVTGTFVPRYKEPEDDQIVPISWGGRAVAVQHRRDGKIKGPAPPTGLNAQCPAMQSKNCSTSPFASTSISSTNNKNSESSPESKQGLTTKLFSIFGKEE